MQTLQTIIYLLILLVTIVSLLTYLLRRARDRRAYYRFMKTAAPVRTLSAAEKTLIQPFLVSPKKPGEVLQLNGEEVYELRGEWRGHGLSTNSQTASMHHLIGGLDVLLPFDAASYLVEGENLAEVVLTRHDYAIVLRLNGQFDIDTAHRMSVARQDALHQWESGGAAATAGTANTAGQGLDGAPGQRLDIGDAVLLGQRDETPAELSARLRPGVAFMPTALGFLPGLLFLIGAGHSDSPTAWMVAAAAFMALGGWMLRPPDSLPPRRKVNCLEGRVEQIEVASPAGTGTTIKRWFLGGRISIQLPYHWLTTMETPPSRPLRVDVYPDDLAVVRLGERFSIDDEARRFPPIHWGRHLTLVLFGLSALLLGWNMNDDFESDLAQLRHGLSGGPASFTSAEALLADPPKRGQGIYVLADRAQCDVSGRRPGTVPWVDCSRLRWGGDALEVEEVIPDPLLADIDQGRLPRTTRNPLIEQIAYLQAIEQMRGARTPYPGGTPQLHVISDYSAFIIGVDAICAKVRHTSFLACRQLIEALEREDLSADTPLPWKTLVEQARSGAMAGTGDMAIFSAGAMFRLKSDLRTVVAPLLSDQYAPAVRKIWAQKRGGVVIVERRSSDVQPEEMHRLVFEEDDLPTPEEGWVARWGQLQAHAANPGHRLLELSGTVAASALDPHGDLVIEIDTRLTPGDLQPALIRLMPLLLGMLFLLWQIRPLFVRYRQARTRKLALRSHLAARTNY